MKDRWGLLLLKKDSEEVTIELLGSSVNGSIHYFLGMLKKKEKRITLLLSFFIFLYYSSIVSIDPGINTIKKPMNYSRAVDVGLFRIDRNKQRTERLARKPLRVSALV